MSELFWLMLVVSPILIGAGTVLGYWIRKSDEKRQYDEAYRTWRKWMPVCKDGNHPVLYCKKCEEITWHTTGNIKDIKK